MNIPASARLSLDEATDKIKDEITTIKEIYGRIYPYHHRHFLVYEGNDPLQGRAVVEECEVTLSPEHLTPQFIGLYHDAGASPYAPHVTVRIAVPRAPNPVEVKGMEAPWRPQRRLKPLFALAPLVYETIRYQFEKRRMRQRERRHRFVSMPAGRGLPALWPEEPRGQDKRPAILIGMHWLEVGGAEKLAFDCAQWALEAGLRVFVVANVASLQRLAHRLPDHPDVQFIRLDRYLPHKLWPRFVERLVLDENIRLVHIHHCVALYESLPQLRAVAPWVEVIDSTHIPEYADGGYPRISGVWSGFIDIHHVISRDLAKWYNSHFQTMSKLKLGRMLTRAEGETLLPPLKMKSGQKSLHVTFIGRLYYQKRPIVMAETFRALAKWAKGAGVELTGTIVGEGPFEQAVTRLLQSYGLRDQVTMEAANSDVPGLLSRSDILILPSNNEGLALVCYEAVERGCIPISTDVGGQAEIVPPELLVPLAPYAAVRATRDIVARLWQDEAFLLRQEQALHAAWASLAADPTAKEVLLPHYLAAAQSVSKE